MTIFEKEEADPLQLPSLNNCHIPVTAFQSQADDCFKSTTATVIGCGACDFAVTLSPVTFASTASELL